MRTRRRRFLVLQRLTQSLDCIRQHHLHSRFVAIAQNIAYGTNRTQRIAEVADSVEHQQAQDAIVLQRTAADPLVPRSDILEIGIGQQRHEILIVKFAYFSLCTQFVEQATPRIGGIDPYPNPEWGFVPFTHPINTIGFTAASIPCGFDSDGMPVGLHIVGKHGDEETVLTVSAAFESLRPWIHHKPSVS